MAKRSNIKQEDEPQGAPDWMVTFSDCMTLLLTFFVLLLSFSSFNDEKIHKVNGAFTKHLSSLDDVVKRSKTEILPKDIIDDTVTSEDGSDKPTTLKNENNKINKVKPNEADRHKVFVKNSDEFFWGRGTAISVGGKESLKTLADFFKKKDGRIVVCETDSDKTSDQLGMQRSLQIIQYLTENEGLDKGRFNMSVSSLVPGEILGAGQVSNRFVQIVMLERRLYN